MKNVKNPRLVCLAICLISFAQLSRAQFNNQHRWYIDLGYTGGSLLPYSGTLGVFGGLGFNFIAFNKPSSIDIRAREMYSFKPKNQEATILTLTYRIPLIKGIFIGIGGAHGHQIKADEFINDPVTSVMGSNEYIIHATGYNTELGYSFKSLIKNKSVGIYPHTEISFTQLKGHHETFKYFSINAGFKIAFKKITS